MVFISPSENVQSKTQTYIRVQYVLKVLYHREKNYSQKNAIEFQKKYSDNLTWKYISEPMCVTLWQPYVCCQLLFELTWKRTCSKCQLQLQIVFSLKVSNFIPIYWLLVELHCHPHCLLFLNHRKCNYELTHKWTQLFRFEWIPKSEKTRSCELRWDGNTIITMWQCTIISKSEQKS